jgi:ribosomal protein S27AE
MREIDMDPRGEYKRECPYCKLQFTANHMNRDYCPSKNGKKDWCKNRYKRIVRKGETDYDFKQNQTNIRLNVKKIIRILNGDNEKIVSYKTLNDVDFNFDAYTASTPRHKINHYAVMVDDYSVELYTRNEKGTYYKIRHLVLKN